MRQTLIRTGVPHAGAVAFSFTQPQLNGPLFGPVAGASRTVWSATTGVLTPGCNPDTMPIDPVPAAAFLIGGTVSTPIADLDATDAHLAAIIAGDATMDVVDGDLVSTGLPDVAAAGVRPPATAAVVSAETAAWIAELALFAPTAAAGIDQSQVARGVLLGATLPAELFRAAIQAHLDAGDRGVTTYVVYALFGTHGQLPIVVGTFGEGYVLVDATNGAVDGPYEFASVIDPVPLLLGHTPTYVTGSGVDVVDERGCEAVGAKTWKPTAPGPGPVVPRPAPPGAPNTGPWTCDGCKTIIVPRTPLVPGYWEATYTCTQLSTGCSCEAYGQGNSAPNTPGFIPIKDICTTPNCPSPTPTPPNAGGANPAMTCVPHYYY